VSAVIGLLLSVYGISFVGIAYGIERGYIEQSEARTFILVWAVAGLFLALVVAVLATVAAFRKKGD